MYPNRSSAPTSDLYSLPVRLPKKMNRSDPARPGTGSYQPRISAAAKPETPHSRLRRFLSMIRLINLSENGHPCRWRITVRKPDGPAVFTRSGGL